MNNKTEISKALQLEGRMQALIQQGYALMNEMEAQPSAAYATTMAFVWEPEALQEMSISLGIIQQALMDIQTQCPSLSAKIFPQPTPVEEVEDDI